MHCLLVLSDHICLCSRWRGDHRQSLCGCGIDQSQCSLIFLVLLCLEGLREDVGSKCVWNRQHTCHCMFSVSVITQGANQGTTAFMSFLSLTFIKIVKFKYIVSFLQWNFKFCHSPAFYEIQKKKKKSTI